MTLGVIEAVITEENAKSWRMTWSRGNDDCLFARALTEATGEQWDWLIEDGTRMRDGREFMFIVEDDEVTAASLIWNTQLYTFPRTIRVVEAIK